MDVKNVDCFKVTNEKELNEIIAVVKLASLFFCAMEVFNQVLIKSKTITVGKNSYYSIGTIGVLVSITILIYLLWLIFSINIFRFKHFKKIRIVENVFFIVFFSVLIFQSNTYTSECKVLFLFIIITSTIQSGKKCGMIIACVSSTIILVIDLIYVPNTGVNLYFQNDLILVGVFILTAWTLGHYVRIENENLKQKNLQIRVLNNELNEQDKQRKYIEETLLKNEACYNLLIENSLECILVHRDGKLIFANESAAKMLGFEDTMELNDKEIESFIPTDEKDNIKEKIAEVYDKKMTMLPFEGRIIKCNGDIVVVQSISTYLIYEGKPTILSIFHDITSEKQVEKLQKDVEKNMELLNESREFNKLITEFFSNISHELKTPLNVIFAAVQLLDLYNSTGEEHVSKQGKYLKMMKQNCYRLTRLINNLLDMTKLDSGFLKIHMQNFNIVSMVEEITLSVATYVESKGISLVFDTDVEEKVVAFDPDKIERIILNLLSNAVKFTNSGGEIYVNLTDLKDNIVISIKDTGVGIPEDKLNMIFERFAQVDKTFRRDCEGSGIGLSLVKYFVEMHGGSINVNSKLGAGSEFNIKIPVKVLEEEKFREHIMYETNIERIDIEFSDIYFDSILI